MSCPVVIQTCDRYEKFWAGLFNFMGKHWDENIREPIYFCNEEKDVDLPAGFRQIKTGKGTFVQNLGGILEEIGSEHVFYMLEDFWPTAPMSARLFRGLYERFRSFDAEALQISSYLPYYSLKKTGELLKFEEDSEWIFNFQARFWKTSAFKQCLVEPEISEREVSSAITAEIASDRLARQMKLKVYLHHYAWYPISGVAYRGEFTEIGRQMENTARIDEFVRAKFSEPA